MVKSALVYIAFLIGAHFGSADIQKCQAYTKSLGGVSVKGAPTTTEQTSAVSLVPLALLKATYH